MAKQWQRQQKQEEKKEVPPSPVPQPGSPVWSDVGLPLDDDKGLFDIIPALADESVSGAGRGGGKVGVSPTVAVARKGQEEEEEEKRGGENVRQPLGLDRAAQSGANPFDEESGDDEGDESGRAVLTGKV